MVYYDIDGHIAGTIGFALDITKRKEAEAVLRESQERFRQLAENIKQVFWIADVDITETLYVSAAYEEIWGRTCASLYASPKSWFDRVHPEDLCLVTNNLAKRGSGAHSFEYRIVGPDGSIRWILDRGFPVFDETGEVYRFAGIAEDITERKRAEEERARLEAENRQLQKAESLGRMAGAIAHLFNNHLAVVIGNLELATTDLSGDAEIRKYMIEAMRAARRSADVSGLMLTYLGQTTDKGEPLDLSDVCRQNLPMLRDGMPEGIVLETGLLSSGPVVRAHPKQMHQVLNHLITNGWESIGHNAGTVTLTTRIVPVSEIPKSYVRPVGWKPAEDLFSCLEVMDTGCGMAEEDLDKIFDPFYTTKFTGRGMGLAVVFGIVKTWGGAIGVESRKNQGSTFRVFLPLVTDKLPRASEKATEAHQVEQGGTVLLVEDQDMVRKVAELMLKRLGYEVLAASDGADAVKLLRENPDLIRFVITDLTMAGMDGWETLTALRKTRPDIPVILVSGYDEGHAMTSNCSERPQLFLQKPYSPSDLRAAIDKALKKPVSTG